ncbi:MAG: hypothetical protein WA919_07535 [Coleofasciculaceae cyanobacterium]
MAKISLIGIDGIGTIGIETAEHGRRQLGGLHLFCLSNHLFQRWEDVKLGNSVILASAIATAALMVVTIVFTPG